MKEKLYFVGIAGTGMASVAGLMQELGKEVTGSDSGLYEPTKTLLEKLEIKVKSPYSADNISSSAQADLYIIANSLSRGNCELEEILNKNLAYTSFPALLEKKILRDKIPLVVCGTHGKTTTTSLLAHCLTQLGERPGYLIGGNCKSLNNSFAVGDKLFIVEGDEYDTAFFDKNPKFYHYLPEYLILNNIEFDHADIYKNIEEIEQVFITLINKVRNKKNIIANTEDPRVLSLLQKLKIKSQVRTVSCSHNSSVKIISSQPYSNNMWQTVLQTKNESITINSSLLGKHNSYNIAQTVATLVALQADNLIKKVSLKKISQTIEEFAGVTKRLEKIGYLNKAPLYFDFAHHPSSVRITLETIKHLFPHKKVIAAFEPKNATSRRNIFIKEYQKSFACADTVLIAPCLEDQRIPTEQQMNTKNLAELIGTKAQAFSSFLHLQEWLQKNIKKNELLIFLSPGDFAKIPQKLKSTISS
jgi:UDP-N-acetylmuramate: L-alanyl-gamma-D-glutamyl-meso-diaminopimelate ligase